MHHWQPRASLERSCHQSSWLLGLSQLLNQVYLITQEKYWPTFLQNTRVWGRNLVQNSSFPLNSHPMPSMFCKSLPVQTSPEAWVQKNTPARGSTQAILRPGLLSTTMRHMLSLHVAEEKEKAQRHVVLHEGEKRICTRDNQSLFWPAEKTTKESRGKEEWTDRCTNSAQLSWK